MAFLSTLGPEAGGGGGGDASLNVESTTRVTFCQTAAPTGWTKSTTHNDKILRVVSGTAANGGAQAFSTVFGSGKSSSSHTLSTPQMPSHTHTWPSKYRSPTRGAGGTGSPAPQTRTAPATNNNTPNAGGSGSHSHTLGLDIQYVDVIIAEKD